jgi:fructose-1,6-bisphosphatase/inositol monophosphatase family enzyme
MNTPAPAAARWKIWAAAAALFVAGLGVGAVLTGAVVGRIVRKTLAAASTGQGALLERGAERVHARLVKELDLAPAQSAAVRRSLDASVARLKSVREKTRDEVRLIARDGFVDIARELTPAQRADFRRHARERLTRLGLDADALTAE